MRRYPEPHPSVALGATPQAGGRVRFTLYAPGKRSIHLLGDFNDWSRDAEPLAPGRDGTWSLTRTLRRGKRRYRYLVDGDVEIGDPYARAIELGRRDRPATSIVEVGHQPYRWSRRRWRRPAFADLILYELPVGDIDRSRKTHQLRGVIDRLDHIASLGVNCIELLPVTGNISRVGWGYDPTHFFAVRPSYGGPDDLKRVVDACHARGIAVVLDLVPAHAGVQHPFNRLWSLAENPYFSKKLTDEKQEFGMPVFDYRRHAARRFMADALRYWLTEFRVDGFRIDYLKMIAYQGKAVIDFFVDVCRGVDESLYLIGEHLPEAPKVINRSGLSGAWHLRPARALSAITLGKANDDFDPRADFKGCVDTLLAKAEGYRHGTQMVTYVESHDEHRVMRTLTDHGDSAAAARRKLALCYLVVALAPGQPMIYAGQEWGQRTKLDKHRQVHPLQWSTLRTRGGRWLSDWHRLVNAIRRDHAAIRSGEGRITLADPGRRLLVMHRWEDAGDEVVFAANLGNAAHDVDVPLPRGGGWRELLTDTRLDVDTDAAALQWALPGWRAAVFAREA